MSTGVRPGWYWRPGWSTSHFVGRGDRAACGVSAPSGLAMTTPDDPRCRRCQNLPAQKETR